MTKPKKPKRQASPGSPEKGLWDPPFLSETLVLKEKAAIYALNRLSPFLGVEDKEFGASNIWRDILQTEAEMVATAMDLHRHFEKCKEVIQSPTPHRTRANGAGAGAKKQQVNSYLPLAFTLDRAKGGLGLSWHEHHHAWRKLTTGEKEKYKRQKRLGRTYTLKAGLTRLHESLMRNHSSEGVDTIPDGMTRDEAYAFRDLVYITETRAYYLRRAWAAMRKVKKTFQALRYHTKALQQSGVFEGRGTQVMHILTGNTPEQPDIFNDA